MVVVGRPYKRSVSRISFSKSACNGPLAVLIELAVCVSVLYHNCRSHIALEPELVLDIDTILDVFALAGFSVGSLIELEL